MIKYLIFFNLLMLSTVTTLAQVSFESVLQEEARDSMSSLAIKPIKHHGKLLRRIIKQLQQDLQDTKEDGCYRVEATFSRDTLAPFSVSCTIPAKVGITFDYDDSNLYESTDNFLYEGPYKLTRQDRNYIQKYLRQFALLSPVHVPQLNAIVMGHRTLHQETLGIHLGETLYPLKKYYQTTSYYDVTAYSIDDAKGRGTYRFLFDRNREKRLFTYGGKQYDIGGVTGTAYFDSHTLHITKFLGKARLLSNLHTVHLHYNIDYSERGGKPVLKRIRIIWNGDGTVIRATVQKIDGKIE